MTGWTEERVTTLKSLWTEGHSAAAVARALGGVTRNAVIGKVHRLGLSGRAAPAAPRATRMASTPRPTAPSPVPAAPVGRNPRPAASFGPAKVAEANGDDGRERAPLLLLRSAGCRWSFGDPKAAAFGFCTATATRGSYCAEHAALAYRPKSLAEPSADGSPAAWRSGLKEGSFGVSRAGVAGPLRRFRHGLAVHDLA